jgi:hypothetical protein
MEKTKEEIVADLYALRAGLSLISQKSDIVKNKRSENDDLKLKNLEEKTEIQNRNNAIAEDTQKSNKSNKNFIECPEWMVVITNVLAMIFFIGFFAVSFMSCFGLEDDNMPSFLPWDNLDGGRYWGAVFICIAVYLAICIAILLGLILLGYFISIFTIKSRRAKENKVITENINKNKKIIADCENRIGKTDFQIKTNNLIIGQNYKDSSICNNALVKQYGSLLNVADWQNLDLIIYYFQTGRADTIKESLQLVDRQKQTEAIIQEIRHASVRISQEINNGFKALGQVMVQSFNSLSMQIEMQNKQTMQALSQISEQNAAMISQTQLNNALRAKANVTSEQLKSDLEYMQHKMGMR